MFYGLIQFKRLKFNAIRRETAQGAWRQGTKIELLEIPEGKNQKYPWNI